MKNELEKKSLTFPFQLKTFQEDEGDKDFFIIEGLASTFGNVDLGGDTVQRGAFAKSLLKRKPVILFQHKSDEPIGVTDVIFENDEGLFLRAKLPKDDDLVKGRVIPQLKAGSLNSLSIGFSIVDSEMTENDTGGPVLQRNRILKEVELFEVSIITFPMDPKALINSVKSDKQAYEFADVQDVKTPKEFEDLLKQSGKFSKKARVYLASNFKPRSDSEPEKRSDSEEKARKAHSLIIDLNKFVKETCNV